MAYIDYLAKCPKHMCASDTVNISMIWPRNLLNLWRAYFSSSFPISVQFLFGRKNPGFYLFSMYPGALARAYKIIKEGLIKGKVYTESGRISVQLPPPMFSVHCASYDHQIHKRFCPEKRTFFAPLYNYPTSWNIQFVQVHPARTYISHPGS